MWGELGPQLGEGAAPQPTRCRAGKVAVVSPCTTSLQLGAVQPGADPLLPSLPGLEQTDQLGSQLGF